MSRGERRQSCTGVYHIMIRGIGKQELFFEPQDYLRMIDIIARYKESCGFVLFAYCLMNNHVHLLLKETTEPICIIMKRIGVSYVYFYNHKYERCGHLFQDRFRSEVVEDERYLFTVWRYILQNPVSAGSCEKPEDYPYSSAKEYLIGKLGITDIDCFTKLTRGLNLADFLKKKDEREIMMDKRIRHLLSDNEAAVLIFEEKVLRDHEDPEAQARAIQKLLDSGVSVRQLSRITGISKGQIEYRTRKLKRYVS